MGDCCLKSKTYFTVEFRFFEPPREMEIGSKNRRWHQIRPVLPWNGFIRSKKVDNNGISHQCVNRLYLPTKRAFKTKRKFQDLRQFQQNKNQYCTDTCVRNFARTLDCISFPLLYQKKVPCTPRFKGTAKFINVLRQELAKCN